MHRMRNRFLKSGLSMVLALSMVLGNAATALPVSAAGVDVTTRTESTLETSKDTQISTDVDNSVDNSSSGTTDTMTGSQDVQDTTNPSGNTGTTDTSGTSSNTGSDSISGNTETGDSSADNSDSSSTVTDGETVDPGTDSDPVDDSVTDGTEDTETDAGTVEDPSNTETDVTEDAETVPDGEVTEETVPMEELTPAEEPAEIQLSDDYNHYRYGESFSSGFHEYGTDDDGNTIYYEYTDNLDEIIAYAEDGMDLHLFFEDTIFKAFTVENLYTLRDLGMTLDDLGKAYIRGETSDFPEDIQTAIAAGTVQPMMARARSLMVATRAGGTIVSGGYQSNLSQGPLGVSTALNNAGQPHGNMGRLLVEGGDEAFCLSYGGSYRSGHTYTEVDYSSVRTPGGGYPLTSYQDMCLRVVVNAYNRDTARTTNDYLACQLMCWFIVNWCESDSGEGVWMDILTAWDAPYNLGQAVRAINPALEETLKGMMTAYMMYVDAAYNRGAHNASGEEKDALIEEALQSYTGMAGEYLAVHYWDPGTDGWQFIITYDESPVTVTTAYIPSIDNYYIEKIARTNYYVEVTKESAITNELLEDIDFRVDELKAPGNSDINYAPWYGSLTSFEYVPDINGSQDPNGQDYLESKITIFGQAQQANVTVKYYDDDELLDGTPTPSGGQHTTTITTDENGFAETTFSHEAVFGTYYSILRDGGNNEIQTDDLTGTWKAAWDAAIAAASLEGSATLSYRGTTGTYTLEQLQQMRAEQTTVLTQTRADAESMINNCYDSYMGRTYTYKVTELNKYTRPGSTDSNGVILEEIELPKRGYRMNVWDATTIGYYEEILANEETMVTGGTNDRDTNTSDINVVNEPWYNQIFINKTDLETNSQILYDTEFEIYEYHAWDMTLQPVSRSVDAGSMLWEYFSGKGGGFNPNLLAGAHLKITNETGTAVFDEDLALDRLIAAANGTGDSYIVNFTVTSAGTYTAELSCTVDLSKGGDDALNMTVYNAVLQNDAVCNCADGDACENGTCGCDVCEAFPDLAEPGMRMQELYGDRDTSLPLTITSTGGATTYNLKNGGTLVQEYRTEALDTPIKDINGEMVTERQVPYWVYTDSDGVRHEIEHSDGRLIVVTDGQTDGSADPDGGLDGSDGAVADGSAIEGYFQYTESADTGIRVLTKTNGSEIVTDGTTIYTGLVRESTNWVVTYIPGTSMTDDPFTVKRTLSVSAAALNQGERTYNEGMDPNDYTTWGLSKNYEIVRVTPEIAKQMGWDDTTIGMYTVHRLQATDQYAGTTFTNNADRETGTEYGYYEYGTLYYTQTNEGRFAIVEKTAPHDGTDSGYLGNYLDRDYTKLDEQSSQKNNDAYGDPYATNDEQAEVKDVHYLNLCDDTNQYATYQLTDGYKEYTDEYYTNYVENLDDPASTATVDGYDADYAQQSALAKSVALERFTLDEPVFEDILNEFWDEFFSVSLSERSLLQIDKHSDKMDTFFHVYQVEADPDKILNFVGTTINLDSYRNNDPTESEITFNGTYTYTQINYNTYAADAEALNARHGFNDSDYLQVGDVNYYYPNWEDASYEDTSLIAFGHAGGDENAAALEKEARYYATEYAVTEDRTWSFIDERTYGFIRFTKYDTDAERYVAGDLLSHDVEDGSDTGSRYEAGTDHGDADLDGAVYSLYVDETNQFTVEYLEGRKDGRLFWAIPRGIDTADGRRIIEGWELIYSADTGDVFVDEGTNEHEDYPHAYVLTDDDGNMTLHFDYYDDAAGSVSVVPNERTYNGIQHPDGQYGGDKHNGFYAVLDEQQVFIDTDNDGYVDTWTIQDVTLENGAKVASAPIKNGELQIDGLYLGDYYLVEEVRDSIVISSVNSDDEESREVKWLSFAPGYLADTDASGNPTKYCYTFPYIDENQGGTDYKAEQTYVQKETTLVSLQDIIRGSFQLNKQQTVGGSGGSNNTNSADLSGAGFTVYLISELSKIQNGEIAPAFNTDEGNMLVYNGDLVSKFDDAGNLVGYEFTREYIDENHPFEEKYGPENVTWTDDQHCVIAIGGNGYDLEEVNTILFIPGHGYYYKQDILEGYVNATYDENSPKWDFSDESQAIARTYEDDANVITEINKKYKQQDNGLASGSSEEWYGVNGIGDGWVATEQPNEYRLSELFTNYNGNIRFPEIPWGAYIVIETTVPENLFQVDPLFVTITDSNPTVNRASSVTLTDMTFVSSLVIVKRDADSGQDVRQSGIRYRIWDYTRSQYVHKYLLGDNGALTQIAQYVFTTDEDGRVNAVASLEIGEYRLEELTVNDGYYNEYWDYGNDGYWDVYAQTDGEGELHGGVSEDAVRDVEDNKFKQYFGTLDFEVTTDRKYKSSGIVSSGNLDYIYIGEDYFNEEVVGKLTILKTGEVLVGYTNTDDIEYADEYTDASDAAYNSLKASYKDRSVFNEVKDYYDLGRDDIDYRTVEFDLDNVEITPVSYIATDRNGMRIAAVYVDDEGIRYTMNGGRVYDTGYYVEDAEGERTFYPDATLRVIADTWRYTDALGNVQMIYGNSVSGYRTSTGAAFTDPTAISLLKQMYTLVDKDGEDVMTGTTDDFVEITPASGILMLEYALSMDVYEGTTLAEAEDMYIYAVDGNIMNTSYLVTDLDGTLMTQDYGVITQVSGNNYKLTFNEAIYDPDIDYDYTFSYGDGRTLDVRYVTYGVYMTEDGTLVYQAEDRDGYYVADASEINPSANAEFFENAFVELKEENSGVTYDFVYEERPLADATFQIRAAEDIYTQDGNGGLWFRKGDVVATLTTGEDGEIVSFLPVYKTADDEGGGTYDYTYYYGQGNTEGTYTSLTGEKSYAPEEFATSGGIDNYWTKDDMTDFDKAIFEIPDFTDETVYPNTFYKEETDSIVRRIYRRSNSGNTVISDYVQRLEDEGNLYTDSSGVLFETQEGYRMIWNETDSYPGASMRQDGDLYTITTRDGYTIEAKESLTTYRVITSNVTPWEAGDPVEKTESGYKVTHVDEMEPGVNQGSTTAGASDMGYVQWNYYPNATIESAGNNTWTLIDQDGTEVLTMQGGILMTEEGGFVEDTLTGIDIYYERYEDYKNNAYTDATVEIGDATLTLNNDQEFGLVWNDREQYFVTSLGGIVTVADDFGSVTVDISGEQTEYKAFDLEINYELSYSEQSDLIRVEKDGTLGTVSITLPLGKYEVQEIATPYGFLINDRVQTVDLTWADQVKGVVFNTNGESTSFTQSNINIWESKGLQWFLGGENTVGEHVVDKFETNFFTWGTYGDAEVPYFVDNQGFVVTYDLRVRAWSQPDVPEKPEGPGDGEITVSKKDITNDEELPGAELTIRDEDGNIVEQWTSTEEEHKVKLPDGHYTLTEVTSPDGYEVAEEIEFDIVDGRLPDNTEHIIMYDSPDDGNTYFSKKSVATGEELPGAELVITNESGEEVERWTSTDTPHIINNLPDGKYTMTEYTAPHGYLVSESIEFEVIGGEVPGSQVVMKDSYDEERRPDSEENQWKLGVGIYKTDKNTGEELSGAKFGLYTTNDIYNVDGKLLVEADTLLATATTDKNGFANFAVDIALMSKWKDPNAKDDTLVFDKYVEYEIESLTHVSGDTYLLKTVAADDIYLTKNGDVYLTEDGQEVTIEGNKAIFTVMNSIDGNTAMNTGDYYIKELTPPDGYLYDDTIYPVQFQYDDEYTMYIPVYAEHANVPTEVTLTKYDLTGEEEIPGATISVYKIKDVNDRDEDGLISHEDDNLLLIDQWVSTDEQHLVTGLLLSNDEWPRLNNDEMRENVYIFREEVPAEGYVTAQDIEFKFYQKSVDGEWLDENGDLYGYDVLFNHTTADEDFVSGTIIAADENADDWILSGQTENPWKYDTVLNSTTIAKWLLVNENLVVFVEPEANPLSLAKALREEDFENLVFDSVYFEFGGDAFTIDWFYPELVVNARPDDSHVHYTQTWMTLDDMHVSMYDDTTKLKIKKTDIVTGEEVDGAHLEIWSTDENGNPDELIDSWVTGDDGYDEDGKPLDHYIENELVVDKEYLLVETLAPTEDGYVKSNTVKFTVQDTGEIQQIVMQDDFTKVEISKQDITTKEEIAGAELEIWSVDENGNPEELIESWISGEDGTEEDGTPKKHYVDYMAPGDYVLIEKTAPAGYLVAEDVPFTVTETGILQHVVMYDAGTMLSIYKYRKGTTEFVKDAVIEIYRLPDKYIQYESMGEEVPISGMVMESESTALRTSTRSGNDLGDYLTEANVYNVQHRSTYDGTAVLEMSIPMDVWESGEVLTYHFPKTAIPNGSYFEDLYEISCGVEGHNHIAAMYEFGQDDNGYYLELTPNSRYPYDTDEASDQSVDLMIGFGITVDGSVLTAQGNLLVEFTEDVQCRVLKDDIEEISSSVNTDVTEIEVTSEDLAYRLVTSGKKDVISGLEPGWYIAAEVKAPNGYILDTTPQIFQLISMSGEQSLTFYNAKKDSSRPNGGDDTPEETPTPGIGILVLRLNNAWWWNNYRTEDTGEDGSSVILTIDGKPAGTASTVPYVAVGVGLVALIGIGLVILLLVQRKREEDAEDDGPGYVNSNGDEDQPYL